MWYEFWICVSCKDTRESYECALPEMSWGRKSAPTELGRCSDFVTKPMDARFRPVSTLYLVVLWVESGRKAQSVYAILGQTIKRHRLRLSVP